jgi:hypothetical protein
MFFCNGWLISEVGILASKRQVPVLQSAVCFNLRVLFSWRSAGRLQVICNLVPLSAGALGSTATHKCVAWSHGNNYKASLTRPTKCSRCSWNWVDTSEFPLSFFCLKQSTSKNKIPRCTCSFSSTVKSVNEVVFYVMKEWAVVYFKVFPREQSGRGVKLTTHLQAVPRWRKLGCIHPTPPYAFMA